MEFSGPVIFAAVSSWWTPVWHLGVGAGLAAIVLLAAYFALRTMSPPSADLARETIGEGILLWMNWVTGVLLALTLPFLSLADYVRLLGEGWRSLTAWEWSESGAIIGGTAVLWCGVYLFVVGLRFAAPKLAAIAGATSKEGLSQPVFYVLLLVGFTLLFAYPWIPYNTFGEDVKMVKDAGFVTITLLAVLFALWTASVSIADEIEGRTALTLLSKPVSRAQFILGKYVGILLPIVLMFVMLGIFFYATVSYKVKYDAREMSHAEPTWRECYEVVSQVGPGLCLSFYAAAMLAAISVAISTRLPMLPNLILCLAVYALGNLMPRLVESSVGEFAIVQFMGRLFALVLPVLDHFDNQAAVAAQVDIPYAYLATAGLYCALYSAVAMLVALFLFEERDLA